MLVIPWMRSPSQTDQDTYIRHDDPVRWDGLPSVLALVAEASMRVTRLLPVDG